VKAIVMHQFGDPSVLRYEDVPTPAPGPSEVLVKVASVSVNNLDLRVRAGTYYRLPTLPHVLGWDPAGTVVGVGSDVTELTAGQRVVFKGRIACGTCSPCQAGRPAGCTGVQQLGLDRWGAYADYVCVPAANLRTFPDNLTFADATVMFRHFPQAFNLLVQTAQMQPGEWVLVMGAAGPLGSCLVQVGKLLGGTVIAAAGSDERAASCLENGADYAVNYRAADLAAEVKRITDGRGVNIVTENIGDASLWNGAFNSLAREGRLVTVGAHGGGFVELDVNALYLKHLRVIGTSGSRPRDVESTVNAAAAGTIRAVIGATLSLSDAAEAHRLAEARAVVGKVILAP
jgi:NADPH2:quinone reductase